MGHFVYTVGKTLQGEFCKKPNHKRLQNDSKLIGKRPKTHRKTNEKMHFFHRLTMRFVLLCHKE